MHRDLSFRLAVLIEILMTWGNNRERENCLSRDEKTTLLIAALDWRFCQIAVLEAVIDRIQLLNDWN